MRTALILVLALLSAVGLSQTTAEREDAIWVVASNRMIAQQDAWFDDGDFPSCIALLKVETAEWPADYDMWTNLGWMQENVEDYPAALATYVQFKELNPQDPDRALPEATYYYQKKQYDKVPALLEPIITVKCHPNNYRMLAWSYEREKNYKDAVRVWKVYVDVAPKDLAAQRNLARDEKRLADASGGASPAGGAGARAR